MQRSILTAIITFVISGIGGALFQRWLSRARPTITISSVGFCGSRDLIQLPERLVAASKLNPWVPEEDKVNRDFYQFETVDILLKFHKYFCYKSEALKQALDLSNNWLEDNDPGYTEISQISAMSPAEVRKHPLMTNQTAYWGIVGAIRRSEIKGVLPIPIPLDEEELSSFKFARITDLEKHGTEEGWSLDFGVRRISFFFSGFSEHQKQELVTLIESFARGIKPNIIHYTHKFIEVTSSDLTRLNQMQEILTDILLPQMRISVEISVYNSGQSAVAFRPYMGLKILHKDLENKAFILSISPKQESVSEGGEQDAGKDFIVENLLPEPNPNPYVNIQPNTMEKLRLISIDPLGDEDSKLIKSIYDTGLLTCQLIGITLEAQKIWSRAAVFGKKINLNERVELERAVYLPSRSRRTKRIVSSRKI